MSKKVLFLSDVHIGMNETWDWYQKDIHEPYLLAMLKYGCDPKTNIDDIVILGDFIDLWLVPPQEKPRTVAEIVKANPEVFKQLTECAQKIKGKVYYITGNHDMSVGKDDVKTMSSAIVYGGTDYDFGNGNGHAVHGHDYSLFNHKDVKGYGGMYPLGYFITRLVALYQQQLVEKSDTYENAAQIPDHGSPLHEAIKHWKKSFDLFQCLKEGIVSQLTIKSLLNVVEYGESLEFVMPEDAKCEKTITANDVIETYKNLVGDFNSSVSLSTKIIDKLSLSVPGSIGIKVLFEEYGFAGLAAFLTDYQDNLFPGAIISRELERKPVVVMGHTHKPIAKSNDAPRPLDYLYLNTGSGCHILENGGALTNCAIVEESETTWHFLPAYQYTGTIYTWSMPNKKMEKSEEHTIKVCKRIGPLPATPAP